MSIASAAKVADAFAENEIEQTTEAELCASHQPGRHPSLVQVASHFSGPDNLGTCEIGADSPGGSHAEVHVTPGAPVQSGTPASDASDIQGGDTSEDCVTEFAVTPLTVPTEKDTPVRRYYSPSPEREKDFARLMDKVEILPSGCWKWTAYINADRGYGRFDLDRKKIPAHHASYILLVGEIPDGMELDHLCRNRWCVNPEHLEPVTHPENMRRTRKAHCRKGHLFTPENTRDDSAGRRRCKTCEKDRSRKSRAKSAAAKTPAATRPDFSFSLPISFVALAEQLWRKLVREEHGQYTKTWSKGDQVMMKNFIREAGPTEYAAILECVIRNWSAFSRYAKESWGGYKPSKYPTVRYLVSRDNISAASISSRTKNSG